ncbi:MAG TPA: PEP/pyruvate-binding domain-containing protein [Anaerolineaceae bacterium]|nr:PEP/pyruvate-binding domain-containing protein [Anaerolineaceae bacterium]
MLTSYTLSLSDPNATLEFVGGKGASLARLYQAGLPVPPGFHVTTAAYNAFVSENNLQLRILSALKQVQPDDAATFETASNEIQGLFLSETSCLPGAVTAAVLAAYASLPGSNPAVAVRSSATAEDLPGLSFAGQQETYLNIHGNEALLDALKRCWASLWTARAIGYRLQHKINSETISLAVVVQILVPAETAGVMFTANPANGRRNQIMISAAWGLGEAVVSGLVTPDTMIVDKGTWRLIERQTAGKEVLTVLLESGTAEQPLPADRRFVPVLNDSQTVELARLGEQIETIYSMPMDIEWAFSAGKFAILQARPITALPAEQVETTTEWKLPDPKGAYVRGSIIEQMPEPLTPLFATLAGPIIDEETRRLLLWFTGAREWKTTLFVTINDYGYLNINYGRWMMTRMVFGSLFKMIPILSSSEVRWQQARSHYLEVIHHWQSRPLADYSANELPTGVRQLTREAISMYTVLQSGLIPAAQTSEIIFTQAYNRLIKKKGDPAAPVFLMGFQSDPIQADLALYDLAMWACSRESLAAHLTATPAAQLALEMENKAAMADINTVDWSVWQSRFQEHLAKYGHSTYDLDFSKSVAADDPTPLLETCRMYLLGKAANPYVRLQTLSESRQRASQALFKRLHGPMRWIFQKLLQNAQKYAPLREDGFADLGLGYPLLRQMLRELGRRLVRAAMFEQPEDVFWLLEQELDQAAKALDQGQPVEPIQEAIRQRKAAWRAKQQITPPMVLPQGSKYLGIDIEKMTPMGLNAENNIINGFGASQGKVTAPARVIHGPQDFNQMQHGDILVAPITTPAWTTLFALASAIVTDIGGPLSHSSIVAREYGIPAVLGTGSATHLIQNGQIITVDGTAGTVSLN